MLININVLNYQTKVIRANLFLLIFKIISIFSDKSMKKKLLYNLATFDNFKSLFILLQFYEGEINANWRNIAVVDY